MLQIDEYDDRILAQYLTANSPLTPKQIEAYAKLSPYLSRQFFNYSWALGGAWHYTEHQALKLHIGRSFRLPSVHELAANGVHHGSFRHERGDVNLNSEVGHQVDFEYVVTYKKWRIGINPFAAYYFNYIFLNPSLTWSLLPDAGQIYQFSQAQVLSYGGELEVHGHLLQSLSVSGNASTVLLDNLTDGYPLPFVPPVSLRGVLSWTLPWPSERYGKITLEGEAHYSATQERVARNELTTPSSLRFDALIVYRHDIAKMECSLRFGCRNLTNVRYFNHLSYYRALGIPEPGRSWNLELAINI